MLDDTELGRWLALARLLNQDPAWRLPDADLERYARAMGSDAGMPEKQRRAKLQNYHLDHRQVQALLNQSGPSYNIVWADLSDRVRELLKLKIGSAYGCEDSATVIDELAQTVLTNIFENLAQFRYASRLHTWIFAIVSNHITHYYRRQGTKKRGGQSEIVSLEQQIEQGNSAYDAFHPAPSIEDNTLDRMLRAAVERVLSEHPDARLRPIFVLNVFEDRTLREIGEQFTLSQARIHALLQRAVTLLRQHPKLLEWFSDEADLSDEEG